MRWPDPRSGYAALVYLAMIVALAICAFAYGFQATR